MPKKPNKALAKVIQKIPIFDELSPTQIQKVLRICAHKFYETNELVCGKGSPGDEMYILVSGRVAIRKTDGTLVTILSPVATIGEMSIITQQPRNVRVEAVEPSGLLIIRKPHFDVLLREDRAMPLKIYRNIIIMLSTRFLKENVRLSDYQQQKRHIAALEQKLNIAVELLAERGLPHEEAIQCIDAKLEEKMPRILIVDDEEPVRSVVKKVLSAFNVVEAENGKIALQLANKATPDLVIADINMPEMDGLELLSNLRDKYPDVPVVGLSGYVKSEDAQSFGFDGFLDKPLSLTELEEQVRVSLKKGEEEEKQ